MHLSKLLGYPTFYFNAEVDAESTVCLLRWLGDKVKSKDKDVTVMLTTFGGTVHDALAVYDGIRLLQNVINIRVVAAGACQSAGNIVLLAAKPEDRFAMSNTRFMVHPVSSRKDAVKYPCDIVQPQAETLREMERLTGHDLAEAYRIQEITVQIYCKNTNLSEPEVLEMFGRTVFFSAAEARTHGFIGQVLQPEPAPVLPRKSWLQRWGRRA